VALSAFLFVLSEAISVLYWLIIVRWATSVFRPARPPRWYVSLEAWAERLTEWLLAPLRRLLPNTGAVDLSPLIAVVGLWLVQTILVNIRRGLPG